MKPNRGTGLAVAIGIALLARPAGAGEIHYYAQEGKVDAVATLLRGGVDPDKLDDHRRTPLIVAAYKGHAPVVRLLMENGADASLVDSDGNAALHVAALQGHAEVVR